MGIPSCQGSRDPSFPPWHLKLLPERTARQYFTAEDLKGLLLLKSGEPEGGRLGAVGMGNAVSMASAWQHCPGNSPLFCNSLSFSNLMLLISVESSQISMNEMVSSGPFYLLMQSFFFRLPCRVASG